MDIAGGKCISETEFDKKLKTCTPITYSVDDAETNIILLASNERNVIGKALCNLCRNIEAHEDLLDFLISKGVFEKVTDLLRTPQTLTNLKYTLKLFGLIVTNPATINKLNKKLFYEVIPRLLGIYFTAKDDFVKEACALILVKTLLHNPALSSYICFKRFLQKILKVISSSIDPDVIKNSLDLFLLLMDCEDFLMQLEQIKRKHLDIFLCILMCEVPPIADIAMDILHKLSSMNVERISVKMAKGNTLPLMTTIITEHNKRYIEKSTDIIKNCIICKQAAVAFSNTKDFVVLCDFLNICDNNSLLRLLPMFAVLTKIPSIRRKLFQASTEDILFQFLKYRHEIIVLNMCKIIVNFSMHKECCQKILTLPVMKYLVEILRTFPMDPYKMIALKGIHSFVKHEPIALKYFPKSGAFDQIYQYFIEENEKYSCTFFEMIVEIISAITRSPLFKQLNMLTFCDKIIDLLRTHPDYQATLLKMTTTLIPNAVFRKEFIACNGPSYLIATLSTFVFTDSYQLHLDILQNMVQYEDMAIRFLDLGLMTLMFSQLKKKFQKADIFENVIDRLYDFCLTLKFYDKNYLGDEDRINGVFFLFQEYALKPGADKYEHIYVVNIERMVDPEDDISSLSSNSIDDVIIKVIENRSVALRHAMLYCSNGDDEFDRYSLPKDNQLEKYINDLQDVHVMSNSLKEKVRRVAVFVDKQLAGIVDSESEEEKRWYFDKHIQTLCEKLGHKFIPIGFLRMGYICEKTLLFKVLCDNVGIPTSFYHEKNGLFWNGVQFGHDNREVYIVDFKDQIGNLIHRYSNMGDKYLRP